MYSVLFSRVSFVLPDLAGVGELKGGKTLGITVNGRGVDVVESSTNGMI